MCCVPILSLVTSFHCFFFESWLLLFHSFSSMRTVPLLIDSTMAHSTWSPNHQRRTIRTTRPTSMHQHKSFAQIILILFNISIFNFVLAAPALAVREIHEPHDNVIIRVLLEDVEGVSEKRGNTLGGKLAYENPDDEGYHRRRIRSTSLHGSRRHRHRQCRCRRSPRLRRRHQPGQR